MKRKANTKRLALPCGESAPSFAGDVPVLIDDRAFVMSEPDKTIPLQTRVKIFGQGVSDEW